jgi:GT2 family glycosyltransferase
VPDHRLASTPPVHETQDVTVVVASRDRRDDLLRSLPHHRAPVVLVDNGSTDGTPQAVRERLPHVQVVALPGNLGACARNVGVRAARTPYVAFADDDSWWAPGSLARAADHLRRHPRLSLLAGRILVGPQERLDPLSREMARAPLGRSSDLPGPDVLGFAACGAVVRRDDFLAVGGFDDVVFFAGEEERVVLDLLAAGRGLAYVDDVVVHHHPSPRRHSSQRRARLVVRNRLLTAWMRRPARLAAAETVRALRGPRVEREGALDAVRRLPAALRRRRRLPAHVEHRLAAAGGLGG